MTATRAVATNYQLLTATRAVATNIFRSNATLISTLNSPLSTLHSPLSKKRQAVKSLPFAYLSVECADDFGNVLLDHCDVLDIHIAVACHVGVLELRFVEFG